MKFYEVEKLSDKQIKALENKDLKHNEYICETAGFEPLEVKFKRFEQAGLRAKFSTSEFTSSDYRDMYLDPDFQIYPDDELEDIEVKTAALQRHIQEIKERAIARANGSQVMPGPQEAEKEVSNSETAEA